MQFTPAFDGTPRAAHGGACADCSHAWHAEAAHASRCRWARVWEVQMMYMGTGRPVKPMQVRELKRGIYSWPGDRGWRSNGTAEVCRAAPCVATGGSFRVACGGGEVRACSEDERDVLATSGWTSGARSGAKINISRYHRHIDNPGGGLPLARVSRSTSMKESAPKVSRRDVCVCVL